MSKDERKFEDVVRSIANSEEDVDKILAAARLTRHEAPGSKLTGQQKADLIAGFMFLIGVLGFFGFIVFCIRF